jgi:hypothetical protein
MTKRIVGFVALILIIASCARKIITTNSTVPEKDINLSSLINKVNSNAIQSKWIQAKAQVSIGDGGFFSSGTVNIRSFKDSLIWVSVSKLGIEVGRGLVRSDSAYITNDWENTYWKGSLKEIGVKYNVPAGLSDIQELVFPYLENSSQYLLQKISPVYELLRTGQPSKKYDITTDPIPLIQDVTVSNGASDLKVKYENYQQQNGYWFPFTHNHQLIQGSQINETKLKFSQVTPSITPLNTPFNIPADYTLIK